MTEPTDAAETAETEALVEEGLEVLDVGLAPTPLVYFASHHLAADAFALADEQGQHQRLRRDARLAHERAQAVGVRLAFGSEVTSVSQVADADLVVAGDGAFSGLRQQHEAALEALHPFRIAVADDGGQLGGRRRGSGRSEPSASPDPAIGR